MSTLELERAKFALEKINGVKDAADHAKYRIELRDLPARLHSAGLGQTIASLLASADNKPRQTIYTWLQEHLRKRPVGYPAGSKLIDCIVGAAETNTDYMTASREARALATWLKKFAEAFIAAE